MALVFGTIWDALQDFGGIEWKRALSDLEMAPDVAYQDILNKFDSSWGVKGLIVIWSNLVVTWKVRLQMDIILHFHSGCVGLPGLDLLQLNFQLVLEEKRCGTSIYAPLHKSTINQRHLPIDVVQSNCF